MKKLSLLGIAFCVMNGAYAQIEVDVKTPVIAEYAVNIRTTEVDKEPLQDDAPVHVKNFSKSFTLDRADKVNLNNQFGSMQIKVWDKKEVKIDVKVTANSNNDKEAQKLIDEVNISADKNGDVVSCKTTISKGGGWKGNNRKREVKVDYVVYMPATNALTLSQQFGNVTMGDFAAPLYAKVQYGNFNAGSLTDDNNYISMQYGKTNITAINKAVIKQQYGAGLIVGTAGTLDLDAQYVNVAITTIKGDAVIRQQYGAGLSVGSVNNLDLDIQYATANIGTIRGNATIEQQYNGLKIGSVNKLNLHSEYAGVTVGALKGDGSFKMSYNSLVVNEVGTGCKNLTVNVEYADVALNFNQAYQADFTLHRSYGSFKYGQNVKASVQGNDDDSSTKNYSGKIGNGGSGNVRIRSEYGSVVFK